MNTTADHAGTREHLIAAAFAGSITTNRARELINYAHNRYEEALQRILDERAASNDPAVRPSPFVATCDEQEWVNDYALDTGATHRWRLSTSDACSILGITDTSLIAEAPDWSDERWRRAAGDSIEEWSDCVNVDAELTDGLLESDTSPVPIGALMHQGPFCVSVFFSPVGTENE